VCKNIHRWSVNISRYDHNNWRYDASPLSAIVSKNNSSYLRGYYNKNYKQFLLFVSSSGMRITITYRQLTHAFRFRLPLFNCWFHLLATKYILWTLYEFSSLKIGRYWITRQMDITYQQYITEVVYWRYETTSPTLISYW